MEYIGEMLGTLRELEQLGRVVVDFSAHHEKAVEASYSGEDAREGQRMDAEIHQQGGETVEVVEGRR